MKLVNVVSAAGLSNDPAEGAEREDAGIINKISQYLVRTSDSRKVRVHVTPFQPELAQKLCACEWLANRIKDYSISWIWCLGICVFLSVLSKCFCKEIFNQ